MNFFGSACLLWWRLECNNNIFRSSGYLQHIEWKLEHCNSLTQPRSELAATSVGNLVLFGGGQTNGIQPSNVVDIFNSTSQTWNNTTLSQARSHLAASSIREIVAFGGGWDGSTIYSVVDMLNVTSNIWFTLNLNLVLLLHQHHQQTENILWRRI
jgi:hypothetical protein